MHLYRVEATISTRGTIKYGSNIYHCVLEIEIPKELIPSEVDFHSKINKLIKNVDSSECTIYDCGILSLLIEMYSEENLHSLKIMSFYRILREGESSSNQISNKDRSKIEKLLNLSMSSNSHEAKVAMDMAIKLMKKNSLTREDIEQQDIIGVDIFPKNKMFSAWEIDLYSELGRISGCYVLFYNKRDKNIRNRIMINGYERDVLNLQYVAQCYCREIENMVSKKKVSLGLDRKGITDYRNGLVYGVLDRLEKESSDFFSIQPTGTDIVPVDTRIDEVSDFLKTATTKHRGIKIRYSKDTVEGMQDSKEIHISKAAEDKNSDIKKISQKDYINA